MEITSQQAHAAIGAAEAKARELAVPVVIAILDGGCHLKAFRRTVQVSSQVTGLREEVKELGLADRIRVERLDLTDPYDIDQALTWDYDVLWNNAGMGEAGPVWEIPVDLVRRNFEVNVFLPLTLTQRVVRKWIDGGSPRGKKVVFTSSMGGLFTPANWGTYVSTRHALESVAEALQQELASYDGKLSSSRPRSGGSRYAPARRWQPACAALWRRGGWRRPAGCEWRS